MSAASSTDAKAATNTSQPPDAQKSYLGIFEDTIKQVASVARNAPWLARLCLDRNTQCFGSTHNRIEIPLTGHEHMRIVISLDSLTNKSTHIGLFGQRCRDELHCNPWNAMDNNAADCVGDLIAQADEIETPVFEAAKTIQTKNP